MSPRRKARIPETFRWLRQPVRFGLAEYVELYRNPPMVPRIYQRPILAALEDPLAEMVSFCGPNQSGKSKNWEWLVEWEIRQGRDGNVAVAFPNDELSGEKSRDLRRPIEQDPELLRHVHGSLDTAERTGDFQLDGGRRHVAYKSAGTDIVAVAYKYMIASEVDRWLAADMEQADETEDSRAKAAKRSAIRGRDNLFEIENRVRTYIGRGGKAVVECTPTLESYPSWQWFMKGSRGRFFLRCLGCGLLSINSSDLLLMQFEKHTDTGDPVEGSITVSCPECGRMHTEDEKFEMAANGEYVHEIEHRLPRRPTFQWGALAVPEVFRWIQIAEAIVAGGWSGSLERQKALDNSFRGLPLQRRNKPKSESGLIRKLTRKWERTEDTCAILMAIDTQDVLFKWTLRSIDDHGNRDHIAAGETDSIEEIRRIYDDAYGGLRVMNGVWDTGGHRATEVMRAIQSFPGMYGYKGDAQSVTYSSPPQIRRSKTNPRLLLANPYWYQTETLQAMLDQSRPSGWDAGIRESTWTISPDIPDHYHDELECMRPGSGKWGHEYRNWGPKGGHRTPHDYFDAEKMWFAILHFACIMTPAANWAKKRHPLWWLKQIKAQADAARMTPAAILDELRRRCVGGK